MNIENVIKKFNYTGELATFLPKLYQEFLNYFGPDKEPIIYEALLNTEIITCNNVYNALMARGMIEFTGDAMVKAADLKRASGVYQALPNVVYDLEEGKFKIANVKRIVAVNAPNFTDYEYSKTVLIHELAHLIKSYYEEFKIEGDILRTRSGLIETEEKLEIIDGKLHKTLISEKSVGLEEGLTSLVEETIARLLVNPDFKVSGYGVVNIIAKNLMEAYDLKDAILNAQMLNTSSDLVKLFDETLMEGSYERFCTLIDKVYELSLKMYGEIFEPEALKKTSEELNKFIIEEYKPFISEINKERKLRIGG